jgi:uncharacterized damage-inducible protein DinB
MNLISLLQQEMEQEAVTTRKMLNRVPDEKFNWQPHPKSMILKRLASHVAEFPGWVNMAITTNGLDFQENPNDPPDVKNTDELMEFFETTLQKGREALAQADINTFSDKWILRNGNQIYSADTKYQVIRMIHSQIIHHRAQLGVYLRLLNIPIPGSYGPSADDMNF